MDKEVQKRVNTAMAAVDENAKELGVSLYREYLEELADRIKSYIDCWEEENREEE